MKKDEYIEWIAEIKNKLPGFLFEMSDKNKLGFFRYSYSGDYFKSKYKWGLGNSVFALKIYYTINQKPDKLNEIVKFIQSFQKPSGEFYDPLVKYFSLPIRIYNALKDRDKNRISHKFIQRAETRQTLSALNLFGLKPKYEFNEFPQNKNDIAKFIDNLNWNMPWGAGSHYSALMFLLANSNISNKIELIDFTTKYIEKFRQNDGCWYSGNPTLQLKINGAMKVITGLKAAASIAKYNNGKVLFSEVNSLIDTALKAVNDTHACENFNLTYVLRYANELAQSNYRYNEIETFIESRLDIYKQFYFPKYGAFSFYKNKTNNNYYGAYISRSKNEPDIHGTVLFLWGLAVIGNFRNINNQIGLREFIT